MTDLPCKTRLTILLIAPLILSSACSASTSATPADSQPENTTIQRDVVYGSGPFNLPDARVGLADLSSYQATLTLSFDGTRKGQPEAWSQTYVMLTQKDPAARQLTIEKTGALTDLDPVFMAEANATAYERIGETACSAAKIETENTLGDRMEPARFLNFVIGADEAGSETVNDIATTHYRFDQQALGQQDLTQSAGELWVASEGGYIVKYVLTTRGKADYFGEGIEGALSFDYEVTAVNQPVEISIPADCPPGLVNAPQLADASNVVNESGVLTYTTATTPQKAAAFYQQELAKLGWQAGEASISDDAALLPFEKDGETMLVGINVEGGATKVQIAVLRQQE